MISFIYWLEQNWQTGIDEISAADKLEEFRKAQANLRGLSFSTISGYASNGAIIHYRATPDTNKVIRDDNLYLLDSGGQYLKELLILLVHFILEHQVINNVIIIL